MAEGPSEVDVQRIVDELRERVRYRQRLTAGTQAASLPPLPFDGSLVEELERLAQSWNVYEAPSAGGRRLAAPLGVIRRTLRRLLAPVLGRQVTFNAATMQIVAQLAEQLDALAARHRDLLEDLMLQHAKTMDELRERMTRLERLIESRAGGASRDT